jgi:protein-disulfide isomerase
MGENKGLRHGAALFGVLVLGLLGCQGQFDAYAEDYMARQGEAHLERLLEKKLKDRAALAEVRPAQQAVEIPLGHSPVLGDVEGETTVVTFLDPVDPASLKLYRALSELLPVTQGVRWVVKLSPDPESDVSVAAATALLAADRLGRFRPYLHSVLEGQADLSEAVLVRKALDAGLDQRTFSTLRQGEAVQAQLQADQRWLEAHGGVRGSTYINGLRVSPRDVEREALARALTARR